MIRRRWAPIAVRLDVLSRSPRTAPRINCGAWMRHVRGLFGVKTVLFTYSDQSSPARVPQRQGLPSVAS